MATNSTPEAASRIAELNDAVNELQGHLSAHKGISDGKSVIIAELEAENARLRGEIEGWKETAHALTRQGGPDHG